MSPIEKITELFSKFPGIGPRQARRFAYYLLGTDSHTAESLKRAIDDVRHNVRSCKECMRYFNTNGNNLTLCPICANPNRSHDTLLIVEKDTDLEAVEKTGVYDGVYFVLGGTVSFMEKKPKTSANMSALQKRLSALSEDTEIILGLSATPEGEHTAEHIRSLIEEKNPNIRVTMLGRGLSTGSELEYVDTDTMRNALTSRK